MNTEEIKNIFQNKLNNKWTGKYCEYHPKQKLYKCESNKCNEIYWTADNMGIPIEKYLCDVRNVCNDRIRCAECDTNYLRTIDNAKIRNWCTVERERLNKEYLEKKNKKQNGG